MMDPQVPEVLEGKLVTLVRLVILVDLVKMEMMDKT